MSASAQQILRELRSRGAVLKRDGDRLTLRAGDRAIPQSLVEQARGVKPDLIALLDRENSLFKPQEGLTCPQSNGENLTTKNILSTLAKTDAETRGNPGVLLRCSSEHLSSDNYEHLRSETTVGAVAGDAATEVLTRVSGHNLSVCEQISSDHLRCSEVGPDVSILANGQDFCGSDECLAPKVLKSFRVEEVVRGRSEPAGIGESYETSGFETISYLPGAVFSDFETRNIAGCKLKFAGAWRYAADLATEILTLTYTAGSEHYLWTPAMGLCAPLTSLAADRAIQFISHAGFEQAIWHHIMVARYGFAPIPIARWHDTQATCAYHALPLDLDRALTVLGLPVAKDKAGRRLVLSLARCNRKTGQYPEITSEIRQRVAEYNRTDVEGLIVLENALGRLPKRERRVWELDQRINQRGLGIDLEFVHAAKALADRLLGEQSEEFQALTDGLNPTQVLAIRSWLAKRGFALPKLDENAIEGALSTELPPEIRRVLEIRAMIASTSLKKLDCMLACVGSDGRARGLLQYHGATPGRWTGRLLQPQNFPRPVVAADPAELAAAVKTGDPGVLRRWGNPIDVLVSGLRHALVAQGDALFGAGDFATI